MMKNKFQLMIICQIVLILLACSQDDSIVLLPPSGIQNGGFEYGNLTGWENEGDARVLKTMDTLKPFEGKFMALLSTGLDSLYNYGHFSQVFSVKEEHVFLRFQWNMIFEEFAAQITMQPQDYFKVSIVREDGSEQMLLMLNAGIAAFQFGAMEQLPGNMHPVSETIFPNAYMTGWQQVVIIVSEYQGEDVTLHFDLIGRENSEYRIGVVVDEVDLE